MRLLLDTHVLLWQLEGSRALSASANRAIEAAEELLVSIVSYIEIGVKASIGKVTVPEDIHEHVIRAGIALLGLSPDHALAVANLPLHHRDPFDRLLIAQARQERLTIVTADGSFGAYGVRVVAA